MANLVGLSTAPSHKMKHIMHKAVPVLLIAACCLTGCSQSKLSAPSASGPGAAVSSDDPVQKKLQELAGATAKSCGLFKSQVRAELDAASQCVMDASKARAPFYVEYELPGMTIALAGNAQGKLYSVQSQAGGAGLVAGDCPAELRVAPSGRVTCYAPGTFPMGAGSGSHSSMPIPPMMGKGTASPHGATGALPPGHPKP
jgi:hypothetical protein